MNTQQHSPSTYPLYAQPNSAQQRGAALIISLILLLIMTIVGISASMNTTMQSKMAGSIADRNMALQAAEHAMRVAEGKLQGWINSGNAILTYDAAKAGQFISSGTDRVYLFDALAAAQPWDLNTAKWDTTDSMDAGAITQDSLTLPVSKNPRYMIAVYPDNTNAQTKALEGVEQGALPEMVGRRYTLSATGWGAQANTRSTIQVEYYSPF